MSNIDYNIYFFIEGLIMIKAIKNILPTAEAIQRLLHPYAEVVVHDIKKNQIAAIFHAFSKRKVGDSSLLTSDEEMATLQSCEGPYEKINWDGRKLKSVSSVIRDEKDRIVGLLCINLDISMFEKMHQQIEKFINFQTAQPEPLFKDDWQQRINDYVHQYLYKHNKSLETLNRQEKKALIEHLYRIGAFTGKNSASYVAQILKLSRATVYNYLSDQGR